MPRGSPFTALCRRAAELARPVAADLHVHTTASDGDYTPSQVVTLAKAARLNAVAVTDHDTLAGVGDALAAGRQLGVEVIPGAELTTEFAGRELHILGLFLRPDNSRLTAALADVCDRRRERFRRYLAALESRGVRFPDGRAELVETRSPSLGRRHVAALLVNAGHARTLFDAFRRFLDPLDVPSIHRTPAADAIRLIRDAGGVPSLAHPPEELTDEALVELRRIGLLAVEVNFPASAVARTARLREAAERLGLAVTGGSDCHGPDTAGRAVGSRGVVRAELAALRELAGSPG
jgi:predicted metal-dependent phosphoesterase TrpH